jgi:tetratricopeptide (TPR) repeat protein
MPVRSALDENALRAIASATEGIYVPLGASGAGLRQIYDQLRELFPEADQGTRIQQIPLERFQWPLGAAILLLLLEPLIAARRRFSGAPLAALALLGGLHLLSAPSIEASPQRALKLYQEGKYEDAARLYEAEVKKNPEDARLRYNYGTTLYRLGQWDEAHAQFTAALRTDDPDLQADAFYNRGNTQYQIGRETEDSVDGRRTKRAAWEAALEDYANALSLDPGAPQVQRNEQLLSRLLSSFLLRVRTAAIPEEAGTTEPTDGFFVPGETVSLEAQANEGWMFRRWESESVELEKPDSAKATFPVSMPTDLAGIFVKTWELEVLTANAEQGTAEKSGTYPEDEPTPIKAEAKDGFAFKSWEAEGTEVADPASPETTVQLTQNAVVTATFQDAFELTVQWSPAIGGTAGTSGWYPIYEDVPVKAEPREGFAWSGWLGEDIADASAPETTVTLNGDRTVTAVFDRLWNLIVAPQQEEQGTTTGSCDEPIGSTVSIAATPSEGYTFDHWEGPGVADPNAAETTVTIQSNEHDVIAVFQSDDQNQDENNDEQNQDQSQENQDQQNQNQSDSSENQNQEQDQSQSENEDSSESESEQSGEPEEQQDNGENTENSEEEPEQSPEEQAGEEKENGEDEPSEDTEEENAQEAGGTEAQPVERVPGQMTAEEARQLLNILRESEKKLPASRSERGESDNSTGRDW